MTPAGVFTTLVNFTGSTGSFLGANPRSALTLGVDGNFYRRHCRRRDGKASVRSSRSRPAGVLTTLVQFTGTAGSYPVPHRSGRWRRGRMAISMAPRHSAAANDLGTVFKVTPTATFTSLATFSGTTGATLGTNPKGALVQMTDGKFYGTTQTGGVGNFGTIFSITPAGTLTTIVNFTGSTGTALGATPQGALIVGGDGAMYGTTNGGGLNNAGSIFRVTTGGLFDTLVNVTSAPNIGRLIEGPASTLVGATLGGGGANGYGTILPPSAAPRPH